MPDSSEIVLQRIERRMATITVQGTAPLIMNKFSEKAKQQMLDKQMGKTRVKKAPKVPEEDYERSIHRLPSGEPGFPCTGFKAATIGAARYFDGIAMTQLRRALFFLGSGEDQLVAIKGEPRMREDAVRVAGTTADLRYRAQFDEWQATLRVIYLPSMLSIESVVALVDAGGMGGIGEWRPASKNSDTGMFGTYQVIEDHDAGPA